MNLESKCVEKYAGNDNPLFWSIPLWKNTMSKNAASGSGLKILPQSLKKMCPSAGAGLLLLMHRRKKLP